MTEDDINKALDSDSYYLKYKAIRDINASPANIDKALSDEDDDIKYAAIRNPNATPANIDKALDCKDVYIRITAIKNKNASEDNIRKALNSSCIQCKQRAIAHENITPAIITEILLDKKMSLSFKIAAVTLSKTTEDHMLLVLSKPGNANLKVAVLKNLFVTEKVINKALSSKYLEVKLAALNHPNATAKNKEKASRDPAIINFLLKS